ncbi:hypothetical protein ANO14919_038790 [Xylariales sp. No.14919]|nr:hypothetical protein ANO14919_038790 [Xylariales sp. No.14919]
MATDVDRLLLRRLPVPPCEGPRLGAYKRFRGDIEFLRLISCDPWTKEILGESGYVFDVRIGKERFALKVFKFYDVIEARYNLFSNRLGRMVSDEMLTFHSDPFFAECRAYGRINQYYEDLNKKTGRRRRRNRPDVHNAETKPIAVPCYGYITIPAEYESLLSKKFSIRLWDRPEREESGEIPKKPFRALVKKLVDSEVSISNPRRMLGHLKQLRKIGISPNDIYARNYKDGLLVDFSVAWTEPHWYPAAIGPDRRETKRRNELFLFDQMMEDEKVKTTVRAKRNLDYCDKLRSCDIDDTSEDTAVSESTWASQSVGCQEIDVS